MTEVKAIYKCADGRDFPVLWTSEEEAKDAWFWDPEHNPGPVTPLDAAIWSECGRGAGRARAECGFAETDVFIGGSAFRYINGFSYWHPTSKSDGERAKSDAANERLRSEYGNAAAFWHQWCLPRAVRAVEQLREATGSESAADLIEMFGYGFEQTFLMWGIDQDRMDAFLSEELGGEGERTAVELTRGFPTATLEADQALWELAQEAKRQAGLRELFLGKVPTDAELRAAEGGPEFLEAFQRYLDYYGWRTLGWDFSSPMVRERPEISLDIIRRTIVEDSPEPAGLVAAAAEEREALIEDIEERIKADSGKLAEFRRRLRHQSGYLGVKEGRALWQLSLGGAIRHALLARGRRLAERGRLAAAEDVFYLLPEEIDEAVQERGAGKDVAGLVTARRAERERWLGAVPPATIGREAEHEHAAAAGPVLQIKGTAASKGVATGTARVLRSLEEHARLRRGDILVCVTTTPAWTALFAVAAGIVSDGGGMLSHTAIAAREYGIPAVVGARVATSTIHDGMLITVDGTDGVVRIEE